MVAAKASAAPRSPATVGDKFQATVGCPAGMSLPHESGAAAGATEAAGIEIKCMRGREVRGGESGERVHA